MSNSKLQSYSNEVNCARSRCSTAKYEPLERSTRDPASPTTLYKIMTGRVLQSFEFETPPSSPGSCFSPKRTREIPLPKSPTSAMADLSPVQQSALHTPERYHSDALKASLNQMETHLGPFDEIATDSMDDDSFFTYDDDEEEDDFDTSTHRLVELEDDELVGLAFVVDP